MLTAPAAGGSASRLEAHTEQLKGGREAIIVTELPYQVKKGGDSGVIKRIAELYEEKKLPELSDVPEDQSNKQGMRIVIPLKRDAIPKVALNKLFKHTPLQATFGVNMVALTDGVPKTLSLREVIKAYVDHQREVVIRRLKHELPRRRRAACTCSKACSSPWTTSTR